MKTIEALGITEEVFKKMYEDYDGFNGTFNKNSPIYEEGEDFYSFLRSGSESLVKENKKIVNDIIKSQETQR